MLVLPPELVPDRRDLPRYGWVLARAFSPAWAAPALWLPYTGQLYAAQALRGLATHRTDHARAVAVLRSAARGPQIVLGLGILAGIAVLYALILGLALVYLEVFDVRSLTGADPRLPAGRVAGGSWVGARVGRPPQPGPPTPSPRGHRADRQPRRPPTGQARRSRAGPGAVRPGRHPAGHPRPDCAHRRPGRVLRPLWVHPTRPSSAGRSDPRSPCTGPISTRRSWRVRE